MEDTRNLLEGTKCKLCDTIEVNDDYVVPDYICDIKKIVYYKAESRVHNYFINGNTIQCEGEVKFEILCLCEDDSLNKIIYSIDFNDDIPYKDEVLTDFHIYTKAENSVARLISSRKFSMKCKLSLFCENTEALNIETAQNKNIDLYKKKSTVRSMKCITEKENSLHISRDIELNSDMPEISNIVYCDIYGYINDIKAVDGKLSLRGEYTVDILYESTNKEYKKEKYTFGLSEIIDNNYPENSACICNVIINEIKVAMQNNNFGEMKIIELDFSYDIEHKHYFNTASEIIEDAFSTEYETECENSLIEFNSFDQCYSSFLSINEEIEIPEYDSYLPYEITDHFINIDNCEFVYDKEKKKMLHNGNTKWTFIAKSAENERYYIFNAASPFKFERELLDCSKNPDEDHKIKIIKSNAEIEKGKLFISAEILINSVIYSKENANVITSVKETKPYDMKRSPLILYYPQHNEDLWSIAKKYKCSCDQICKFNNIANNDISKIKVLLIPKK